MFLLYSIFSIHLQAKKMDGWYDQRKYEYELKIVSLSETSSSSENKIKSKKKYWPVKKQLSNTNSTIQLFLIIFVLVK